MEKVGLLALVVLEEKMATLVLMVTILEWVANMVVREIMFMANKLVDMVLFV